MSFKTIAIAVLCIIGFTSGAKAQQNGFSYRFDGYIRTDYFMNTRQCYENADGFAMLYPKDREDDPAGRDKNSHLSSNLFSYHTSISLYMSGPDVGKFQTSGEVTATFYGTTNGYLGITRVKAALLNLQHDRHLITIGLRGHDFTGLTPEVLNLNRAAPFEPCGRAPQIRYQYKARDFTFIAAALWQTHGRTFGPNGASSEYLKNSGIPEMQTRIEYNGNHVVLGTVLNFLSIRPRLESEEGYKVFERVNGLSYQFYGSYQKDKLSVLGKVGVSQNLTHLNSIGGYGVTKHDERTGEQAYKPLNVLNTWVNVAYGDKWRGSVFGGFLKNLGASQNVTDVIGRGTNVAQMYGVSGEMSYNFPHLKVGVEYSFTQARYGTASAKGRVVDTHGVENHRLIAGCIYNF